MSVSQVLLTDIHTLFHPPTTLPPLQVDTDKIGKDSDHNIVVFAPKTNRTFKSNRKKKIIKTRPLPESPIHTPQDYRLSELSNLTNKRV